MCALHFLAGVGGSPALSIQPSLVVQLADEIQIVVAENQNLLDIIWHLPCSQKPSCKRAPQHGHTEQQRGSERILDSFRDAELHMMRHQSHRDALS